MNSQHLLNTIDQTDPLTHYGKVNQIVGLIIESVGPADVALGELCVLGDPQSDALKAEVVGFRGNRVLLMPFGEIEGIRPGTHVFPTRMPLYIPVGHGLQGRILDGLGQPIDGAGQIHAEDRRNIHSSPPDPLSRRRVQESLGTGVRALDGMVSCGKGQRMGIFAGSGVGKSTLLNILGLLDSPTSGTLTYNGRDSTFAGLDLTQRSLRERAEIRNREFGFVFQFYHLLPDLSVLENVMLPAELRRDPEPMQAASRYLERVGLAERTTHYPRQLSGGEQQRVAMARAFASRPRVLFADEPTGNLDLTTGARIADLLFELNREEHTTLVLVTHDESLAGRCDRRMTLAEGRTVP